MGANERAVPPGLLTALTSYPGLDPRTVALDIRPLAGGLLHASFLLTAPDGEYIAQRVNPIFDPRIHDNIAAVTRHIAARGLVTVALRETTAGSSYVELNGGERWRVMEKLPGVTFDVCASPAQAASAGALVGRFHTAVGDFDTPLAPLGFPYHDTPRYFEELREAVRTRSAHPRNADVARLAERLFAAATACRPPHDLPLRVLHGDLKFNNVLFAGASGPASERAVALIDLDTVSRLPLYFDLGDALRSWSNRRAEDVPEAELDVAIFAAAASSYLSAIELPLAAGERASLDVALENVTLELCSRFATDVLRESYFSWDASRFASAAEHNWARARGQWSLYEQARDTASERRRALGTR